MAGRLVSLLLFLVSVCSNALDLPFEIKFFDQIFDHSRYDQTKTWKQRYLISDHMYEPGGPILMYAGNEADIFAFWNNTGFIVEIAKDLKPGPLILYPEHRYYGESLPYGEASFNSENMHGLTAGQALADFVEIVQSVKAEYANKNAEAGHKGHHHMKVLAFGGSYGGMLSAWMRFRYPHVITAAYAASAPVHTYLKTPDAQYGFFDVMLKDFKNALPNGQCTTQVGAAFQEIRKRSAEATGMQELTHALGLCKPLKTSDDIRQVQFWLIQSMVSMSMMDYPASSSFMADLPAWPVDASCNALAKAMESDATDVIAQIRAFVNVAYNHTGQSDCFDIWQQVQCADRSGCGSDQGESRSWAYQACTELSMNLQLRENNGVIPLDVLFTADEIDADCMKRFGVKPDPNYIANQFSQFCACSDAGSRILWTNGNLDPWSSGGILTSKPRAASDNPSFLIDKGAHHLDLKAPNPATDPPSVVKARQKIRKWIKHWLQPVESIDQELTLLFAEHEEASMQAKQRCQSYRGVSKTIEKNTFLARDESVFTI